MTDRQSSFAGLATFDPRLDRLPPAARRLWPRLEGLPIDAVLYGGTALALRLGHRVSEDFDLFLPREFAPGDLRREQPLLTDAEVVQSASSTLTVRLDEVRVSLFGVRFAALDTPELATDIRLPVASLADLAATKAWAVLGRAEARDYVDLAALLRHGLDLAEILGGAGTLYGDAFSPLLAMKALVTFDEGTLPAVPDRDRETLRAAVAPITRIPVVGARHSRILPDLGEP